MQNIILKNKYDSMIVIIDFILTDHFVLPLVVLFGLLNLYYGILF